MAIRLDDAGQMALRCNRHRDRKMGAGMTVQDKKSKHRRKGKKTYFPDYCRDRRAWLLLYLLTAGIFLTVCSLYQLQNLMRLMYAFLLSLFFWICYCVYDYMCYAKKRRRLALAAENLQQASELLSGGLLSEAYQETAGTGGGSPEDNTGLQWERRDQLLNRCYEELIEELCSEKQRMQSKWEEQRSEREDYYLMWAHQIKTPIAAMKLLLNGRDDRFLLTEELFKIEQYVEMVLHYLRLESMSSDMLLKEYDLYEMVKQTVKKFSILFINGGLSLKLGEFSGTMVLTDEKWLGFVLEQLLSNSIKYTRKGNISIYVKPDEPLTLVIEDTGIGIRAEDLPRIFERGFTGYNGRMDRKSTGIGLYLTKQVLEKLGHTIKVESRPGEGTRVSLGLAREKYG